MKLIRPRVLFISFLLSTLITSCGQTQKKDLLLGNWTFDKFEFKGELANIPTTVAKKENDTNQGLVITFLNDNKYISKQKGGIDINNSKGTYLLLPDDRLVIMGDTSKIIQLDKTYLILYRNELSPVVIFKRL